MCSSGNCNAAGLINGPVGNIVGVGIRALINGAPIGPKTSQTLNKQTDKERIENFYDNVEAHLKGALQILQPALEIGQIISGASKSAERDKPAIGQQIAIQYYSPQNPSQCRTSHCLNRCCCSKKSTCRLPADKTSSSTSTCFKNEKSTAKNATQSKSCSSYDKCSIKKNVTRERGSSFAGETIADRSRKSEINDGSRKNSTKSTKITQRPRNCCICDVSLRENVVLAELPCKHLYCYTCLAVGNKKRCRKCDGTYDVKNVTQILHER